MDFYSIVKQQKVDLGNNLKKKNENLWRAISFFLR